MGGGSLLLPFLVRWVLVTGLVLAVVVSTVGLRWWTGEREDQKRRQEAKQDLYREAAEIQKREDDAAWWMIECMERYRLQHGYQSDYDRSLCMSKHGRAYSGPKRLEEIVAKLKANRNAVAKQQR